MEKAKRYNKGKLRYELIPSNFLKALAEVYTKGAHKYSVYKDKDGNDIKGSEIPFEESSNYELIEDASANWRKGMNWMDVKASHDRHMQEWMNGEDLDPEIRTLHLANAAWNLATLIEYYKIYPQGDNRPHTIMPKPKIGLDIDEVLCDWVGGWTKKFNLNVPKSWFFDYTILERFEELRQKGELDEFYLSLKPLVSPCDIPFEPHCYVTSRPVSKEVSMKWLEMHGFPSRPVITVGLGESKVDAIKNAGVDIFVDDRYDNYEELNRNGICCFLFDSNHNQRYNVGYKRIKSLKELTW